MQGKTKIMKLVEKINQALLSNIGKSKAGQNMKKKIMVHGRIFNEEVHGNECWKNKDW